MIAEKQNEWLHVTANETNESKVKAWDLINRTFWDIGHKDLGHNPDLLARLCENILKEDQCCLLGASMFPLIKYFLEQDVKITVVDFSKAMCNALRVEFFHKPFSIINDDILSLNENHSGMKFDTIITDQILNCIDPEKISLFFSSIANLLADDGEFRCVVKLGLYKIDVEILKQQKLDGAPLAFSYKDYIFDYSKCENVLARIINTTNSHGKLLLDWYLQRGQEKRYVMADFYDGAIYKMICQSGLYVDARKRFTGHDDLLFLKIVKRSGN